MVWLFAKAVFKRWVPAMTGLAGLLASVLGAVFNSNGLFVELTAIAGVALLFFAFYRAWADEHTDLMTAKQSLQELTKPDLLFTLGQIVTGTMDGGSDGIQTVILLQGRIVNRGASSSVIHWEAHYRTTDFYTQLAIVHPRVPFRFPVANTVLVFDGSEALSNKAVSPIPKGGFVEGRIALVLSGNHATELRSQETHITVVIHDYLGKAYEATFRPRDVGTERLAYAPGDQFG